MHERYLMISQTRTKNTKTIRKWRYDCCHCCNLFVRSIYVPEPVVVHFLHVILILLKYLVSILLFSLLLFWYIVAIVKCNFSLFCCFSVLRLYNFSSYAPLFAVVGWERAAITTTKAIRANNCKPFMLISLTIFVFASQICK